MTHYEVILIVTKYFGYLFVSYFGIALFYRKEICHSQTDMILEFYSLNIFEITFVFPLGFLKSIDPNTFQCTNFLVKYNEIHVLRV